MSLSRHLGAALAFARCLQGRNQDEVATACGIRSEHLSRYERAVRLPSLARLAELAEALNMDPWMLAYCLERVSGKTWQEVGQQALARVCELQKLDAGLAPAPSDSKGEAC